jgi:oligopeptide/dipeptide ABC transporter ATP-binding protein
MVYPSSGSVIVDTTTTNSVLCASFGGDVPLLEVRDLKIEFRTRRGVVRAVDGVSIDVEPGKTLGIVGESGCGKSVTALSIMGLVPMPPGRIVGGSIIYHGDGDPIDLSALRPADMRRIRGNDIAMVFQEPMTSLNPVFTVGHQIEEPLRVHRQLHGSDLDDEVLRLLSEVGIPSPQDTRRRFPHQLSGGMRQRVMIAMALSCNPTLLIADEPTTALDVTIQAQVLALMNRLRAEYHMTIAFITHDLGVIARMVDDVAVMYLGKIVERSPVQELFARPLHPYTRGLMASIPSLIGPKKRRLTTIRGVVPEVPRPSQCEFADRCPDVMDKCRIRTPGLVRFEEGHSVRCFLHSDTRETTDES